MILYTWPLASCVYRKHGNTAHGRLSMLFWILTTEYVQNLFGFVVAEKHKQVLSE